MQLYWTSIKSINGLKHFVLINEYKIKGEVYLEFVSVLDDKVSFKISKKDFEESGRWISGWKDAKENIVFKEYKEFKLGQSDASNNIILQKNSQFNIS